jgi:RNA polymerase sigma factor (TIGR02999 family)
MPDAGTITRLLVAADAADPSAADELYRLVAADLALIARKRKRVVGADAAADASTTGLVDDAFVRLVGGNATVWQPGDRRKFFSYMARKIHGDLIDLIRRERAEKRGGAAGRAELPDDVAAADAHLQTLLDLRTALAALERFDPDGAAVVRLRNLLGCTAEEAADVLGVSKTEGVRRHQRAMLWLRQELRGYADDA